MDRNYTFCTINPKTVPEIIYHCLLVIFNLLLTNYNEDFSRVCLKYAKNLKLCKSIFY